MKTTSSATELAYQNDRDVQRRIYFPAKKVVCTPCERGAHASCTRPCTCPPCTQGGRS